MIELQQWRVAIGSFLPPPCRKSGLQKWKCVIIKGFSTWTMLCVLALCGLSRASHPSPHVNTLLLAGDVELNPGPGMVEGKEILDEIKALRKDHEEHFEILRQETSIIKSEMKSMRAEVEEIKNQIHTQSLDIDEIHKTVEDVQEKVTKVEEDVEKLERYSRRENVILYGITDSASERTEAVKPKLVDLLNEHAKDKLWNEHDFVRAHRLGTFSSPDRPRPIIARLKEHDDKFIVLKARNELNSKAGVGVANDLTPWQRSELRRLRDEGKRGYFKGGKLCIDPNPIPRVAAGTSPGRGQHQHLDQGHERGRYDHRDDAARRQASPPVTRGSTSRNDRDSRRHARDPPNQHTKSHK